MPLTPGTKLGQYEVVESIGAGGMGEVYRALDTKLGRDVAVKVLPEEFARDKERLDRFEREARLLAQLNHTNIATLYGLEEHDGQKFIVMELVEGETLAERIARGPIPIDEAIPLFIQIAEGLEAAHEKAIIHRDLKPANIKIGPDGKPKILDFGLAKAFAGEDPTSSQTESPTVTRHTEAGVILGTAPYMSPEQARGKGLDKRTDTWAFGCVLYEALTGRVAFLGETVSDTIAGILKQEPEWRKLPANTPSMVRSLLRRCLNKDPSHRVQHIGDARIELEESLLEASVETPGLVALPQAQQRRPRRLLLWSVAAIALLLALFAGSLAVWNSRRSAPSVARFTLELPDNKTLYGRAGADVVLSPDGTRIVYVGREEAGGGQLYLRSIDQLEATPIAGTEGAIRPFFSPDGEWIGFRADHKLKKVWLQGGAPVILADAVEGMGFTWGEDDTIVFVGLWLAGLSRVSADGGTPEVMLPADASTQMAWPHFLPGGKKLLFTLYSPDKSHIAALSLDSMEPKILSEGLYARYAAGYLVYGHAGSLFAVPFDPEGLEMRETPVPVIEGVRMHPTRGADFSLSRDGALAYVPGHLERGSERTLLVVDREGHAQLLTEEKRDYWTPRFSPDGKRIVVGIRMDNHDLWTFDLEKKKFNRLTFSPANEYSPVWSPDGSRVVFTSYQEDGGGGLFSKPADGSQPAERLTSTSQGIHADSQLAGSWSQHGNLLALEQDFPGIDIHVLRLDGDHNPEPFTDTPSIDEFGPKVSPDGRWIAYSSRESGRWEVYVQPFPEGSGRWQVSPEGGNVPVWGPDGREIFYRQGNTLIAMPIETEPEFASGKPRPLFEISGLAVSGLIGFANYDVSPDGQTFVMVKEEPGTTQINVVLNWLEEVKRLVPTGN